ncbi:hypothetical protein N4R57_15620 [Rhodobacteraceae bacterium D3-12]|nr:hypothetical protein N4R57_15620 [Rhodobacteraceae bacterium D3-12]
MLTSDTRGSRKKATSSPLAGKLFDETGDRLTPSHTRKKGKRLRYYVSRRVIAGNSKMHPNAWRLPAEQVESLLTELVRQQLSKSDAASSMTQGLSATEIKSVSEQLKESLSVADCLKLIERAHLKPGSLRIQLDAQVLAETLKCRPQQFNELELSIEAPFQMRRRGVELKLHLGDPPPRSTSR